MSGQFVHVFKAGEPATKKEKKYRSHMTKACQEVL